MRRECAIVIGVVSLVQSGCGGSQAQRALAQAAAFAAIEVAGAAMQAAADQAAARDARRRAQANRMRRTPAGNWRLVRSVDGDADSECNEGDEGDECDSNSDSEEADATSEPQRNESTETTQGHADAGGASVGGCMVCE